MNDQAKRFADFLDGSPNLRAFLRVIRHGESSQVDEAYRWLYGSTKARPILAATLADHPRVRTYEQYDGQFIKNGKLDYTTAAGAYQITETTWGDCVRALGLPDFSPRSQDIAAVYLMHRRGALAHALAGDVEAAIARLRTEWVSLPGASVGDQPSRPLSEALAVFARYRDAGAASTYPPTNTEKTAPAPAGEVEQSTQEDRTMSFSDVIKSPITSFVLGALNPILAAVPEIAKIFMDKEGTTVPERNVAAAIKVVGIAQEALNKAGIPAQNEQAVGDAVQNNPAARDVVRAAVIEQYYDVMKASEENITAARKFALDSATQVNVRTVVGRFTFIEFLSLLMMLLTFSAGVAVLILGGLNDQLKGAIVMLIIAGGFVGVKEFWLGSSHGSKTKDARPGDSV